MLAEPAELPAPDLISDAYEVWLTENVPSPSLAKVMTSVRLRVIPLLSLVIPVIDSELQFPGPPLRQVVCVISHEPMKSLSVVTALIVLILANTSFIISADITSSAAKVWAVS
jgi:hypothetical protein